MNEVKDVYNTERREKDKEIEEVARHRMTNWRGLTIILCCAQLSSKLMALMHQNSELKEQAIDSGKLADAHQEMEQLQRDWQQERQDSQAQVEVLKEELQGHASLQEENRRKPLPLPLLSRDHAETCRPVAVQI